MKGKIFRAGVFACALFVFFAGLCGGASARQADYKARMVDLISDLHDYAKSRNPAFQLMGNNGLPLFRPDKDYPLAEVERLLKSVDGIFMEEYNFGWEMKDGEATPPEVRRALEACLAIPRKKKLPLFNVDYANDEAAVYRLNRQNKLIGFAADSRLLNTIPKMGKKPYNESNKAVKSLGNVGNFLILLNPEQFRNKTAYLSALKNSNYDLLILDPTFNGDPLTEKEVALLKRKKNGAARLVFAYMSVGEAEEYRPYWRPDWKKHPPEWVAAENEDWPGNYKVKYWTGEWRDILYGNPDACMDKILAQGFDGAFLDVIDAFAYFSEPRD